MDIQTSAVLDTKAVHGVVLNVDVVNGTLSKYLAQLNKVVWLGKTSVTTETIPPCLTVAIEYGVFLGGDFNVGSSHLDEGIVCIGIFPECLSLECHLGSSFQL